MKRDELGVVPPEVVLALRDAVSWSSVDDFWSVWSKSAEAVLFRAYCRAGGPTAAGSLAFLGRGLLRIRSRCLGGRAVGGRRSSWLYRASKRLKSVEDVLEGIRNKGFTLSRWDALLGYLGAVCRHGPCGPISSLGPWDRWIPPDLHGFKRWVFDSLEVFIKQVVVKGFGF